MNELQQLVVDTFTDVFLRELPDARVTADVDIIRDELMLGLYIQEFREPLALWIGRDMLKLCARLDTGKWRPSRDEMAQAITDAVAGKPVLQPDECHSWDNRKKAILPAIEPHARKAAWDAKRWISEHG